MNENEIIKKFKNKKIIVIGDIMLDRYVYGSSNRISPEAPVVVMNYEREEDKLGGAGNVALNIMKLGGKALLIGTVGNDEAGAIIKAILSSSGLRKTGIVRYKKKLSTIKTRLISNYQQVLRVDKENRDEIDKNLENKLISVVKRELKNSNYDAAIISDYGKGLLTKRLLKQIISLFKAKNIFVAVDPKGIDFTKYYGVNLITPNKNESEIIYGTEIKNDKDIVKSINLIKKQTASDCVVITKGKNGLSYRAGNSKVYSLSSYSREVFDVTGAGDTFISSFTLAYLSSNSWEKSAKFANKAAGISVTKLGTSQISESDLLNSTNNIKYFNSIEDLSNIIASHKSEGKKIVFTNGCFDLFHQGHLEILRKSKESGDILIVAVNSDKSVKKLKGKSRPLTDQEFRASLLSSIDFVDYVVIFDEDTPINLIKKFKPDLITKGGDYKKQEVVGGEFVNTYGGKVEIIPLQKDFSTSNLIKIIKTRQPN